MIFMKLRVNKNDHFERAAPVFRNHLTMKHLQLLLRAETPEGKPTIG